MAARAGGRRDVRTATALADANVAGFIFVVESLHRLAVNRKFLAAELRPPLWREAALVVTALCYGTLLVAVVASLVQ